MKTSTEKIITAILGYLMFLLTFMLISGSIYFFTQQFFLFGGISALIVTVLPFGFMIINPNEAMVITLFGVYKGTIKENGFMLVNPFSRAKKFLYVP